jgi:hypothetical protein
MGSQELLLYNIDDAVIFPPTASNWENKQFSGVVKSELIRKLNVTPELFIDALLMVGTSFLPHFPPLLDDTINRGSTFTILDAINQLRTAEKSVANVCAACSDILARTDPNWLDKYRKAKMGIKHCVTVQLDGTVNIRDYDSLTGDNVEYLGLQLPPELYHYFSKAMIGPRLMNSFGSLESLVFPTLDGVVSEEYRKLVTESLPPLKETAASLISSRIHRGFQFKDIAVKFWFDDNLQQKLIHRNVTAQTNQRADTWGVRDATIKPRESATGVPAGKLSFALLSLQDKEFATKSVSKEKITNLNSKPEVISNALWRLLHLRGYVNDQHELTSWGKALATALGALAPVVKKYNDIQHIEEAAFLAFELIRFDNLNSRHRHQELIGGPLRGSDSDKENCILIGRTSCLLKLRHNAIGYTGPLSKNLLAFHSLIKAVRETDRDLVEAITASMFLNGQVSRERSDFGEIGRRYVALHSGCDRHADFFLAYHSQTMSILGWVLPSRHTWMISFDLRLPRRQGKPTSQTTSASTYLTASTLWRTWTSLSNSSMPFMRVSRDSIKRFLRLTERAGIVPSNTSIREGNGCREWEKGWAASLLRRIVILVEAFLTLS